MDNNLNGDEIVLLYIMILFLVSQLLVRVQAGISCFTRNTILWYSLLRRE